MNWTTIKERLKSKVVWTAVIAQVLLIITCFNADIAAEIKAVAIPVLEILSLFGVLNNPSDSENF